jgi:hypothetical protein
MNEERITQTLKNNIPSAVETPTESMVASDEPVLESEPLHNNLPLDNMVLTNSLMDLLNIPMVRRTNETRQEVEYILRWASENSPTSEMYDILETVAKQSRMLGIQMKENKMDILYRYAKLNNQRKMIETQMKELSNG